MTAVNSKLEDSNIVLELQLDFTEIRISKKKLMPGEQSSDDAPIMLVVDLSFNYRSVLVQHS